MVLTADSHERGGLAAAITLCGIDRKEKKRRRRNVNAVRLYNAAVGESVNKVEC